jgi:hypothetical protein
MRRSLVNLVVNQVLKDLSYVKPRIDRFNKRFKYEAYEYDKGIYIIDVKGVKGSVDGRENILVSNFWALFIGLIRNVNAGDIVDVGGVARDLRSSGDVNAGIAYLVYGSGITSEAFTQNALASYVGSISTTISISYLSDRTRITFSGTLPADAYEIGVQQYVFTSGGSSYTYLFARKAGFWSKGSLINYFIDYSYPWIRQIGDLMYGVHRDADTSVKRVDGSTFTARTSADFNVDTAYIVLSSSPVTWSPSLYNIPSPITPVQYAHHKLDARIYRAVHFNAVYTPTSDTAINSIALYQLIYDTAGGSNTVCLLVIPLSSPATAYANKNNVFIIRIFAM